ncbi:hypothetical protein D3C81_1571610 [compost metagenome]
MKLLIVIHPESHVVYSAPAEPFAGKVIPLLNMHLCTSAAFACLKYENIRLASYSSRICAFGAESKQVLEYGNRRLRILNRQLNRA